MSIIKVSTRGNSIEWTATFKDFDGALVSPSSARLYLAFNGGTDSIAMSQITTGEWTAEWDSSVAKEGAASWSIRTVGPSIAADGQVHLSANPANPDPA